MKILSVTITIKHYNNKNIHPIKGKPVKIIIFISTRCV